MRVGSRSLMESKNGLNMERTITDDEMSVYKFDMPRSTKIFTMDGKKSADTKGNRPTALNNQGDIIVF